MRTGPLTGNYVTTPALAVPPEPAHAQGDNGGKTDRLEEENKVEHDDAGDAGVADSRGDEDDAAGQEAEQHDAWPDEVVHQGGAGEAADCKSGLGTGEELRSPVVAYMGRRLGNVVDEEAISLGRKKESAVLCSEKEKYTSIATRHVGWKFIL